MIKMRKMDWRQKVLLSIIGSTILIMGLFFFITYRYFVRKLETSNEKIVAITFEHAENELEDMMENAELHLNQYANDDLIWTFVQEYPDNEIGRSTLAVKMVDNFSDVMSVNHEVSALGVMCGNGRTIVSSAAGKNRFGDTKITDGLGGVLSRCKENYPYVMWIPSWELNLESDSPLGIMMETPALVGLKALGEGKEPFEDSYLVLAMKEEGIQKTFESVAFNKSKAVLVNEQGMIISDVGENLLGKKYAPDDTTQNIEYALSYSGWKMCNMIPKKEYLQDARNIRNFGIAITGIAIIATAAVAVVWSRKYTRPIQNLMENMHRVGNQEFDIEKPERWGWRELDQLNEEFYSTVQSLKEYIVRLKQVEREKAREELLALQYQMNPHFLFNSLNSIRWMAMMTNNTVVADALVTLGKIITPILRNPSLTWKVENELEFLDSYVSMMRLRYGHDMDYIMECPEELYGEEFPRFILQPLIENCFVHGSDTAGLRTVHVSIKYEDYIGVQVINSGVYYDEVQLKQIGNQIDSPSESSGHVGLANIKKRLDLLYGSQGKMWMESNRDSGFIVHIRFPRNKKISGE